jgi:uncharacterized protein (TIGR03546 family)
MVNEITNLWTKFRSSVKGVDTSRQLAAGVAIGMVIGLVPKDSLFTLGLLGILIFSRANLISAFCSAVCFSWIGPLLDPVTHEIGIRVLTFDPFETTWAWLIELPVVPWTRFDNSVVTGSLCVGILALIPVYRLSLLFFETFGAAVYRFLSNTAPVSWFIDQPHGKSSAAPTLSET